VQLSHPRASNVIRDHMYVDDDISGADSAEDAKLIVRELQSALDSADFPLRKWTSSHKEILAHVQSHRLLTTDFLEIDTESTAKTLGLRWKATSDEFFFVPPDLATEISPTKRQDLFQIFFVCAKTFILTELSFTKDVVLRSRM